MAIPEDQRNLLLLQKAQDRQAQGWNQQQPVQWMPWTQPYQAQTNNAWTPTPFASQTPYAQAQIRPAQINADTARYATDLNFLGDIQQSPWNLAQVSQAAVPNAQASMYGSYANSLANILGSYYPAAADIQTAHYDPWSQVYQSSLNANLQRDLMQMGNEAQYARQQSMLGAMNPIIAALANQSSTPWGGIQTNYGAGIS